MNTQLLAGSLKPCFCHFWYSSPVARARFQRPIVSSFLMMIVLLFSAFYFALPAFAQTSGGGSVTVSAIVPTTVSASKSSFVADVQTLPADGSSRLTLTA